MIRIRPNDRSILPIVRNAPSKKAVRDIRRWCFQAARKLGIPGLPLIVRFSFTSSIPSDLSGRTGLHGLIQLNRREWGKCTRRAQRRIIVHELCHVAEMVSYACLSEHGKLFQRLMRKAGVEPNAGDIPEKEAA